MSNKVRGIARKIAIATGMTRKKKGPNGQHVQVLPPRYFPAMTNQRPHPAALDASGHIISDIGKVVLHKHRIAAEDQPTGLAGDEPADVLYGKHRWHCDDIADVVAGEPYPDCVRQFVNQERLPAYERWELAKLMEASDGKPFELYATTNLGYRVRVVMCSRFGDVGITRAMNFENGYEARCLLPDLTNFSATPVGNTHGAQEIQAATP